MPVDDVTEQRDERAQYYDTAREMTPFLGVQSGSATFLVRTEDKHVGRSLFMNGGRGEMIVLRRAVSMLELLKGDGVVQGSTFLEVGANIGTTTIPALLDHGFGAAVAFEPEPSCFNTLKLNAVANGLDDRLSAIGAAVSNQTGRMTLAGSPEMGGKHWLANDEGGTRRAKAKAATQVEVDTVTLDQMVAEGRLDPGRVGMFWMDAQGSEGHVLEGAGAVLEHGPPIVLEWDPGGLDRVGGLDKVTTAASANYTHFIPLRKEAQDSDEGRSLRPAGELGDYTDAFIAPGRSQGFTDILLLRLEPGEVLEGDIYAALRERNLQRKRDAKRREKQAGREGAEPAPGVLRRIARRLGS
jgi:FkbM family methyltransferase